MIVTISTPSPQSLPHTYTLTFVFPVNSIYVSILMKQFILIGLQEKICLNLEESKFIQYNKATKRADLIRF